MSDYENGQILVDNYEILPFEFLERFIHQGLFPHKPGTGRELTVKQVLSLALDTREMERDLRDHLKTAREVGGKEGKEIITDFFEPLQKRINKYKEFQEININTKWNKIQLSEDDEINDKIITALLQAVYNKKLYEQLEALDQFDRHGIQQPKEKRTSIERPSTHIHRKKCKEIAEKIRNAYPDIHPAQVVDFKIILNHSLKGNGEFYTKTTLLGWIRHLWTDLPIGRPKKINVKDEDIEKLFPEYYR